MSITIILQNVSNARVIPLKSQFKTWVDETLLAAPQEINKNNITIRIVDKLESAQLNETYRQKKEATNVLSFPDDPIPGFESDSLGDVIICAPLVILEANKQNKEIEHHWAHLTVHGVLHLLGYDHIQDKEAEEMEGLEEKILNKLRYGD